MTAPTAIVVQSLGLALPTSWLSCAFAIALYAIGGTTCGTKNVLLRTLLHRRVPSHLQAPRRTLIPAGALPTLAGRGRSRPCRRRPVEPPVPATEV